MTKTFAYNCEVPVLGAQPFDISVTVTPPADPVAGQEVPASAISTVVQVPITLADAFYQFGVRQVKGTASTTATINNGGSNDDVNVSGLTIPVTPTPEMNTAPLPLNASGTFPAVTPAKSGATTISVGDVMSDIRIEDENGDGVSILGLAGPDLSIPCTLQEGVDPKLLSFDVAEAPGPVVEVDYAVNGTATQATTGDTTKFGPGSLDAVTDVDSGNFSGKLTLPDIDIPDYQLFGLVPTTVKAKVVPEGRVTGTINEDGTLTAKSTVNLQLDELSVFGLPLLTPGSKCKTVAPTTVDLTGPNFDPETGGTLTGSYTAANFSGCGLLGFFIEPILNDNVSGIANAISVDFTAPAVDEGPLE